MSRKVDRFGERIAGRRNPDANSDERLATGVSINGRAPLIAEGDDQISLVQVRCWCGVVVAVVWQTDGSARTGRKPFYFVESAIIDDAQARPVKAVMALQMLSVDSVHIGDCPAHGRHTFTAAPLLREARKALRRATTENERVGRIVLPPPS